MIIYNTTFHLEDNIEELWLKWMKETYIPLLLDTSLFTKHLFCKVLVDESMGGKTYSLQLFVRDMNTYNQYDNEYANKAQAVLKSKWRNQILTFSTLLEQV